jgi:hypothetical protein
MMQIKFFEKVFCSAKYHLDFDIWILACKLYQFLAKRIRME